MQNNSEHCQQTFESKTFVDITQQCFALLLQINFPVNNLNFHWGEGDGIESGLSFKIFSTLPSLGDWNVLLIFLWIISSLVMLHRLLSLDFAKDARHPLYWTACIWPNFGTIFLPLSMDASRCKTYAKMRGTHFLILADFAQCNVLLLGGNLSFVHVHTEQFQLSQINLDFKKILVTFRTSKYIFESSNLCSKILIVGTFFLKSIFFLKLQFLTSRFSLKS